MSYEQLGLADTLPFGKHRGSKVVDVMAKDPGWLAWIRAERQKKNKENFFTEDAERHIYSAVKKRAPGAEWPKRLGEDDGITEVASSAVVGIMGKLSTAELDKAKREELYKDQWGEW